MNTFISLQKIWDICTYYSGRYMYSCSEAELQKPSSEREENIHYSRNWTGEERKVG